MKHLILATLLVAPVAVADSLPTRNLDSKIQITGNTFLLSDKSGQQYAVKTNCDMDNVTTFETKSRAIREGTRIRVAKDHTCRVQSVEKS